MNDAYQISKGIISVVDENGNKSSNYAYDNSAKILEKQNNIETINKNININNKKIIKNNKDIKFYSITSIIAIIAFTLGLIVLNSVGINFIYLFGMVCSYLGIASGGSGLIFGIINNKQLKKINNILNREKGKEIKRIQKLEMTKKPVSTLTESFDKVSSKKSDRINSINSIWESYCNKKRLYYRKFKNNRLTTYLEKLGYDEGKINAIYELLENDFKISTQKDLMGYSRILK